MTLCADQAFSNDIFLWLGVIVAAAVVLGVIALILRRVLMGDHAPPPIGFTLADLRQLHENGELSDEEFAQAKGRMLAQSRAMLDAPEASEGPGSEMGSGELVDGPGWDDEGGDEDASGSR